MNKTIKNLIIGSSTITYYKPLKRYTSFLEKNDYQALSSDWEKVGKDLKLAIAKYSK